MKRFSFLLVALVLALPGAAAAQYGNPDSARVVTTDVQTFMRVQQALTKARSYNDSALVLFKDYYLPGTPGLRDFIELRIGSPFNLMRILQTRPKYYAHLPVSLKDLPARTASIAPSFRKFKQIYPEARFTDVYFVVGRMTSGGTTSPERILIGTEMYGRDASAPADELNSWQKAVLRDLTNIDAIVVHELMHINQPESERPQTLLTAALLEGGADFVAELVTGGNINGHIQEWANSREKELWTEFQQEMSGKDFSKWLFNGASIKDRPADLGYWMGYRITRAYYERASDKHQAIADILQLRDPQALLADSHFADRFK